MRKIVACTIVVFLWSIALNAITITVNCNKPAPAGKISTYLKLLNPQGPNTLNIRGTCKENLAINQFGRLSLIGISGATIQDASDGTQPVISITDSQGIFLQGLTIIGGSNGVTCFDGSVCRFSGNTIEQSSGAGAWVSYSQASFGSDVIQDTGDAGLSVEFSRVSGGGLTIRRNAWVGIYDANASAVSLFGINVLDNKADGILVVSQAHLFMGSSTVSGNAFNGIDVNDQSEVLLLGNTVSGNAYSGVAVGDLSLANLGNGGSFTNNGMDIACLNQVSVAKNLQGVVYATTNCPVPAVQSNAARPESVRPPTLQVPSK
jgi:parallel beta-helix repeat protein